MADLGTIEGKVVVRGLGEAKQNISDFDRILSAFSDTAEKRFKRVKVSSEDVAKAMGLTGDAFKKFQDDALRAFTATQAVKGLETLARNCGFTREKVQELGQQMGLTEQAVNSLVTKLNLASSTLSSQKFFGDFYKVGQHTAVIPTADIEKSVGTFEKAIEVAFGRIPVTVNTATAAVDDAFAKGAVGISSGARRYAEATANAINDFYKVGQHTAVVQSGDVFETMFRDIDKTNEAFEDLKETVKTSTVPLTAPLSAFDSALATASITAKRSSEIIGTSLGYSEKQLAELSQRAQRGIEVKVKTDALRVLRDEAKLSKEEVVALEKQLGVKLDAKSGLFGEKGFGDILKNTFAYGSAYQLLGYIQQIPGAIFSATEAMDKFEKTYTGVFGSSGAAQMQYVRDEARKYGKELESISKQNLKFAATAEYLGMSQDSVRKIFDSTVASISKVGGSTDDVNGALVAMEQMLSKGTVSAEEFRSQFAERIPGAMKMGADAMGVTTAEFRKMMEEGRIVAQDFLPKLADQMSKFAQGWEKGADSIEANKTRAFNAIKEIAGEAANGEWVNAGVKIASGMLEGISSELKKSKVYDQVYNEWVKGNISTSEFYNMGGIAAGTYKNMGPAMSWLGNEALDIPAAKAKLQELKKATDAQAEALKEQAKGIVEYIQKVRDLPLDVSPDSAANIKTAYDELARVEKKIQQLTGTPYTVVLRADVSAVSSALAYIRSEYGKTLAGQADIASFDYDSSLNAQKNLADEIADLQSKVNGAQREGSRESNEYSKNLALLQEKEAAYAQGLEVLREKQEAVSRARKAAFDNTQAGKSLANADQEIANASRYNTFAEQRVQIEKDFKNAIEQYTPLVKDATLSDQQRAKAQEAIAAAEKYRKGRLEDIAQAEASAANKGRKSADQAARYAERTSAYLEQAQDQYDQLVAQLGGDSLSAKLAAIDKRYDKAASAVRQAMIGAKGSTAELNATLEVMGKSKAIDILLAQADAWKKSMSDAANMLGELGRLSGDPSAIYGSSMTTAQAWEADQAKRIGAIEDEAEREKQLGELRQVMALKEVEARRQAYESISTVSSKYWEAEKERIETHLEVVKKNADDENAYKIYAAQQWDEYNKKFLEQQAQYAGTFGEMFAAKWSLAFGGYKSETIKARESWDQMSDSIISSTNGMIDGIAGGFGDLIRNIGNGTASIEDLWKNMLARMLDAFASFVEDLIKQQLKDLVGGLLGGDASGQKSGGLDISSLFKGSSSSSSSNSAYDSALFDKLGDSIGKGTSDSLLQSLQSSSSGTSLFIGDAPSIGENIGKELSRYGDVWNASSAQWSQGGNTTWQNGSFSSATAGGSKYSWGGALAGAGTAAGGVMGMLNAQSALSAIGSGVMTAGGIMMMIPGLQVAGAVTAAVGGLVSLFGQENKKEIKKVAEGYNVMYAGGKTVTSGVDFYSDGSVVGTGVGDPDVTKKISDAFKEAAENLSDFADVLGFTVDVLDGFTMPSMNITDDQIDTYIRNGSNAMAFQALEQAGLRGAFDVLAEDGEVYIDEVERLSAAYSTGASKLSAYGYDMADVAQVTQDQIDALREQTVETAAGTSQAILTMASSMGATSDQLALLAANASDGSQALAVTDEQLTNLLTADWVSKVEDQVGGEDAFNSIMDNLLGNVFDTIDAYANNLDYYNEKASKYISQLGDDTVTVENFWEKFNAALKEGMDPETFELWGKASSWVNSIDSVNEALDDWNEGMKEAYDSLEARLQKAQGYDAQAEITNQLISAEKELYEARKAGYEAAYIAKLQEVQAAEMAALEAKNSKEAWNALEDLAVREKKAAGDPYANASSAYFAAQWEYKSASESGLYNANDLARLKAVQEKEIQNYYDDIVESVKKNASDAHSKLLRALGQTDAADLYDKQVEVASTLKDALKSNLYTAEAYADLVAATSAEVQNLIEQQAHDAEKYTSDIQARYLTSSGKAYDAAILTKQVAAEQELFEARQKGLAGTATYAQLEQVLAMEMADLIAQQTREQESYRAGLQARILTAQGYEYEANEVTAMAAAEAELADARAKGYDAATLALLAEAQAAEAAKRVADQIQKIRSDWDSLESRLSIANGDSLTGKWTAYKSTQEQELYDALSSGKDQSYYNKLKEVQQAEAIAKWKELIEDAINDIKDKLNEVVSKFKDAMDSFNNLLETQISATSSLTNNAESVHKSLQSTIKSITVGDDSVLTGAQKAQSLSGQINTAYQQMLSAGHGQGRIDAASTLESLAQDYLSALRSSSNSDQYLQGYLDTISKLKEAQSITGQEQNYQIRLLDLMEAEKNILELINKEISKQTPDIEKLKALQNTSGMLGGYIQGLYNNDEATVNSWQKSVVSLLSEAGFSGEDIASALNGSSMTSFLDAMNEFNRTTLPTYFDSIISYLAEIADTQETPIPPPVDGYTGTEKNWASNLAVAMNAQHYGGSAAWSQASVLKNLATYAAWGNNYGISSTQGYSAPKSNDKQYYYGAADLLNAKNGDTRTWLDIQNDVTSLSGSGNYLAHWLQYGFSDNIKFPSVDAVMKKTADYFEKKWKNEPSLSASPLTLAHDIADIMGLRFDNSAATLEYIAKKHYDTWIKGKPIGQLEPSDWGLVQPYALGGIAAAGTFGLVGEEGPELVQFGDTTRITPHNDSLSLLGDSYSVVIKELKEEIKKLRSQTEYNGRALREITQHTKTTKEYTEQGMTVGFPTKAVA